MITRRGLLVAISASLIVGCAIGLITGVLFARSLLMPGPPFELHRRGPEGGRRPALRYVERRLGLTPDQSRRFAAVVEAARTDADSMHALTRAKLLEILTPEQRQRWQRMNERMFGRRRGRDGPGPPPDVPAPPDSR